MITRLLLILAWLLEKLIDRFAPSPVYDVEQPVGEWIDPELLRHKPPVTG